jgi:hypothetical protein
MNFFLFPTQPYINPHKALNFSIKFIFSAWKYGSWDGSIVRKTIQMLIENNNNLRNMACVRKGLWRIGTMFFLSFFEYRNFGEIWPRNSKISRIYTWKEISNFFSKP